MTSPAPAAIHCDARGGIAQLGFDRAFDELLRARRDLRARAVRAERKLHHRRTRLLPAPAGRGRLGRVRRDQRTGADDGRRRQDARLLHQSDRFRRAARRGPAAAHRPGVERDRLRRSSGVMPSAARRCRRAGRSTPMDEPTTDPHAAMRGALLAFGGARGANIALMVEVLAAGLSGANWALDAPSFTSGDRSPGVGPHWSSRSRPACSRRTFRSASDSSSNGSRASAFIFRGGEPPPPKSNCPTRSSPKSSARWKLDPARGVGLHVGRSSGRGSGSDFFDVNAVRGRFASFFKPLWRRQWPTD